MKYNNHSEKSSKTKEKSIVLDLQDKLYISNKNLQETILRAHENDSLIKQLQDENLRMETELNKTKKELRQSQKILKQLITFYKEKEKNKECSLNKLWEENSYLKVFFLIFFSSCIYHVFQEQLNENSSSYSLLKQAENKIENLEYNLSKIEENNLFLPEIEQRLSLLQIQNSQKLGLIEKSVDCIYKQFSETFIMLSSSEISTFPLSFKFFEINEKELHKIDKKLLEILQKLDFSDTLKKFIVGIMGFFENIILEKFLNGIKLSIDNMEDKITKLINVISIIEIKKEMQREYTGKKQISKITEIRKEDSKDKITNIENKENLINRGNNIRINKSDPFEKKNFLENFLQLFFWKK